jgi:hypothetical protein
MYQKVIKKKGALSTVEERREVALALALMVFGVVIGFTGSWLALKQST